MVAVLKTPGRGQIWATNNLPAGFLDSTHHWANISRNIGVIMDSELNLNRTRTITKSAHSLRGNMARNAAFLTEQGSSEHRGCFHLDLKTWSVQILIGDQSGHHDECHCRHFTTQQGATPPLIVFHHNDIVNCVLRSLDISVVFIETEFQYHASLISSVTVHLNIDISFRIVFKISNTSLWKPADLTSWILN